MRFQEVIARRLGVSEIGGSRCFDPPLVLIGVWLKQLAEP